METKFNIKHIIEMSLQARIEVEDFIKFNCENNYKYEIVATSNLIDTRLLQLLLRNGYEINAYSDKFTLKHKEV